MKDDDMIELTHDWMLAHGFLEMTPVPEWEAHGGRYYQMERDGLSSWVVYRVGPGPLAQPLEGFTVLQLVAAWKGPQDRAFILPVMAEQEVPMPGAGIVYPLVWSDLEQRWNSAEVMDGAAYLPFVRCFLREQGWLKPNSVGDAGAVFAFAAWLSVRPEQVGPFGKHLEAGQLARLAGEFCDSQGWQVDDSRYPANLAPLDGA